MPIVYYAKFLPQKCVITYRPLTPNIGLKIAIIIILIQWQSKYFDRKYYNFNKIDKISQKSYTLY